MLLGKLKKILTVVSKQPENRDAGIEPENALGQLRSRTDVFISYAREDRDFVKLLRDHLEAAGLSVWVDDSSIPAGSSFLEVIYAGIEGSSTVMAVLSKHFQESRFCRIEIEHAALHRKRMVPVRREEVAAETLHPELRRCNWVDFPVDHDFDAGAEECLQAIRFDLDWAVTGVRFLQLALDWQQKHGDLLGRAGVADLKQWLSDSSREGRDCSTLVQSYFQASVSKLWRSTIKTWSILVTLVALLIGVPLYVVSTTPSRAWMPTDVDTINANDVVVTTGTQQAERIWIRRDLETVHHPHPHDPGDDIFETKYAIYELNLRGMLLDEVTYFLESYASGSASGRWRVGDFRFGDSGEPARSVLANEVIDRLNSMPHEVFEESRGTIWNAIAPPKALVGKVASFQPDIELKASDEKSFHKRPLLNTLHAAILEHRKNLVEVEYPNRITNIEIFELRSGAWLAFVQIMHSGMRYDLGVLPALSEDKGHTWMLGTLVPRLKEGGGFHFNAQSVRAVVELGNGEIWAATEYNLSTDMGHPSGAPGQVAKSLDGGLSWSELKLPNPLDSVDSFTGLAVSAHSGDIVALSIEDKNATTDTAGPRIWLSENFGSTWQPIDKGLNVDPLSRVRVLWVDSGPRIVAVQQLQNGTLRPLVFRLLSFLERLRGRVGIERL